MQALHERYPILSVHISVRDVHQRRPKAQGKWLMQGSSGRQAMPQATEVCPTGQEPPQKGGGVSSQPHGYEAGFTGAPGSTLPLFIVAVHAILTACTCIAHKLHGGCMITRVREPIVCTYGIWLQYTSRIRPFSMTRSKPGVSPQSSVTAVSSQSIYSKVLRCCS